MKTALAGTLLAICAFGQTNSAPNPYHAISGWFKMPEGRVFGSAAGVAIDKRGHIWVAERCEAKGFVDASCAGSKLDPIFEFDESGKILRNFGGGLIVMPHGLSIDADGNIWVTDNEGKDGKGNRAIKFSPEGNVLTALEGLNRPDAVAFAPNGDIFLSEGHGGDGLNRISKYTKSGKLIKRWGKTGTGPGEFDIPHCLVFDSKGRLLVCDRNNNRIQIFDQQGNFIQQLTQFSRPSGIAIDKNDTIYVADSESESVSKNHFGWKRGIRIGSLKDGKITAFIPDPAGEMKTTSSAEGIAIDSKGIIYGAEVVPNDLKKYVRQ